MSPNTVRKYVAELVERGLIQTVQKMCKSVQSQNQPGKTGCFAQPKKLDFNGIYCAKSSSFIQTTILHDTPVL